MTVPAKPLRVPGFECFEFPGLSSGLHYQTGQHPPSSFQFGTYQTYPPHRVMDKEMNIKETIRSWPKAELHCHLDGSLRLETMLELATAQGKLGLLPGRDVESLDAILLQIDKSSTLEEYLSWFSYSIPLMQSKESLRRIAYELVQDAAAENVRYLEIRYAPILHIEEGLTIEQVNEAVLDGMKSAGDDFGVKTGLIISGLRDRFESASLRQAELAVAHRDKGVVGFDLAGGEAGNPPKHHLHAFYFARNHRLNLTVHAGESWGPDSISQALFHCGAHRIGHGTSLHEDAQLMQFVLDHQIPLEICPTSNVQTSVVDSFESHPVALYIEKGIQVSINTDNRLFSHTDLTSELLKVYEHNGIEMAQLKRVVLDGFRHAFLPFDEKKELVASMAVELGLGN